MKKIILDPAQSTRLINHGPVVLVTSGIERPNIFSAAWNMPVAREGDSALVALAINPDHYSYSLIKEYGQFAFNVPGKELLPAVIICGSTSGRKVDKFEKTGLTHVKAHKIDVPLIDECLGHLECTLEHEVRLGDHVLLIGRVVAASVNEEIFDGCWIFEKIENRTIHHLGAEYFCYPEKRITAG
ncbi:MAG: flavin reductase family protein [Candidatus Eremiobacteraeota bacterium]|nr:flavin reductase family protein [Candidatus Eremiobacteraeota bacterium]